MFYYCICHLLVINIFSDLLQTDIHVCKYTWHYVKAVALGPAEWWLTILNLIPRAVLELCLRTHQFSEVSALVVLHKPLQQRVKGKNTMILKVHFKLTLHKQYVVPNSNKMKHEQ